MIQNVDAPRACDRSTNMRSFTESTWLRMIRDVPAQPVTPITRMTIESFPKGRLPARAPRSDTSTIASGRNGMTRNQSSIAVSVWSIQPPKKPAEMPMTPPMTAETSAAEMPTIIEMRVPRIRSERTSRPFSSVPSQWADDGAARIWSE